jgi:ABC-type antimicrobial peptide transport system permease subunit
MGSGWVEVGCKVGGMSVTRVWTKQNELGVDARSMTGTAPVVSCALVCLVYSVCVGCMLLTGVGCRMISCDIVRHALSVACRLASRLIVLISKTSEGVGRSHSSRGLVDDSAAT